MPLSAVAAALLAAFPAGAADPSPASRSAPPPAPPVDAELLRDLDVLSDPEPDRQAARRLGLLERLRLLETQRMLETQSARSGPASPGRPPSPKATR
jgi:hypothetical protein